MTPVERRHRDVEGRRRDAAFILPTLCALILLPPFVNLFVREVLVWGMPLEVLYIFGVWFALVLGAMVLARRLGVRDTEVDEPPLAQGTARNANADSLTDQGKA